MNSRKMKLHHERGEKPPQEEMVGHWIGFVVVTIIFSGLFANQWWAIIPRVILLIASIEKTIKFIQNKEARESYNFTTTQEEMIHYWIATIIVSIVMNSLFHGVWFSQIPCAVLFIKSLETTYSFIKAQNLRKIESKNANHQNQQTQQNQQYQQQYQDFEPENYSDNNLKHEIFCQMCGRKKFNSDSRYCPICGAEYRIN